MLTLVVFYVGQLYVFFKSYVVQHLTRDCSIFGVILIQKIAVYHIIKEPQIPPKYELILHNQIKIVAGDVSWEHMDIVKTLHYPPKIS